MKETLWGPESRLGLLTELTPSVPLSGSLVSLSERGLVLVLPPCPQASWLTLRSLDSSLFISLHRALVLFSLENSSPQSSSLFPFW